ncbi:MAG: stage V sporulation protein AE [Eubacteriales bacterium]|nr:stage V sporulation protein AE [Eubacteriales bacterium]
MIYLYAFIVGGILCAIGQIFIDKTMLTPARILVGFVVGGAILTAVGLYEPLVKIGGAGATVPISGFGYLLAKGAIEAVRMYGWTGAITGGVAAAAGGITAAVVFGFLIAMIFNPKEK